MPVRFLIIGVLLTSVIPILVATVVFFVALHQWIDRNLRAAEDAREWLKLEMRGMRVVWTVVSNDAADWHWPYRPLVLAAIAAVATTAIETVVFAVGSNVAFLWYVSGAVAGAVVLIVPFAVALLLRNPLRRLIGRKLRARARDRFAFASETILEIGEIGRQLDETYASIGLTRKTDVLNRCRQAVLQHAGFGHDSTLAELVRIKIQVEYDLRSLQYLAHLFANVRTALDQAKIGLHSIDDLQDEIRHVESGICELADALKDMRWPDARRLLKEINSDLGRLLDIAARDVAMPRSVGEAYSILNVTEQTPIEKVKAVVNVYRRVWHPDLAGDEMERQRYTLRMQQIHVAWSLIQEARR